MVQRALLATRRAVRDALRRSAREADLSDGALLLVALSGGADSLALAAAAAHEAPRAGFRAGAVVVDHGLQQGSDAVAAGAALQAESLGLSPVHVIRVDVEADGAGPEAAARAARYRAFDESADRSGAAMILTAHTANDLAEQVLLGLARGSGTRSLAGIPPRRGRILRPFLGITRAQTEAACAEAGVEPWRDPHNADPAYSRVRVRERILPVMERELGPGISAGLGRTAELMREDADALDGLADELAARTLRRTGEGVELSVAGLAEQPAALRNRVIRLAAAEFGAGLSREHTLAVAALVVDWRGQGPVFVPGIRAVRDGGAIRLVPQSGSPRTGSVAGTAARMQADPPAMRD